MIVRGMVINLCLQERTHRGRLTHQAEVLGSLLSPEDLHGIWHGFVAMRGWRDGRVPQDCLWASRLGDGGCWGTTLCWDVTLWENHHL